MKVLVSDTSVLIDLERGGLLEAAFSLSYGLAVPDLLYENELRDYQGPALLDRGLLVESLSPVEVDEADGYQRFTKAVSVADAFALALAHSRQWILLTGDRRLRRLATDRAVRCHGVLWFMDRMLDESVISAPDLRRGLVRISSHPRCRLPAKEIALRLMRYGG